MKSYLIDEIPSSDMESIREEMDRTAVRSGLEKLYWIEVPEEFLTEEQLLHKECGPHVFAVELGLNWVRCEFFVRALNNMKCSCNAYATARQTHFAVEKTDRLLEGLGVRT
ncbi:MAG: hypothetical protein C4576_27775 [Desulfobacteraceae bacterium]|nr:MAG: hypothetical protein C4576_27775 [Desulfobacteraceae bacterium]